MDQLFHPANMDLEPHTQANHLDFLVPSTLMYNMTLKKVTRNPGC